MRKYFAMYENEIVNYEYYAKNIEEVKKEVADYIGSEDPNETSVMEIWSESTHPFEHWENPRYF